MRGWTAVWALAGAAACLSSPESSDAPVVDAGKDEMSADAALGCPEPVTAPGGACEPPCEACEGALCQIDCSTGAACTVVDCPAGFDCEIECTGKDSCLGVTINCPADHACSLICDGEDACEHVRMACGGGPCSVECRGHLLACADTQVACGAGPCAATCDQEARPADLACGDACACDACGA